jgi:hypothetical protein
VRRRADIDGSYNTRRKMWITGCGDVVYAVHDPSACEGRPCVVHNPSDHSMRGFKTHFRFDRYLTERICPHGIGHPDPDDLAYQERIGLGGRYAGVHGCDGCCA